MENHLGANIKNFRKNKGYTQEELAEIHDNGTFSEDEYKSAQKEFREKIYIL